MRQLTWLFLTCGTIWLAACSNSSGNTAASAGPSSGNTAASGSGDDLYYELTTKTTSQQVNLNMTTKMYMTRNGDMRSEMSTTGMPGKKDAPTILIGHLDKPTESILLDPEKKTYVINHIDTALLKDPSGEDVEVTKIGEEKVNGYNSVHARIIKKTSIGSIMTMVDTLDMWKSTEVPVLPAFQKVYDRMFQMTTEAGTAGADKLKAIGCTGFVTKMTMNGKHVSMDMELTKVEKNSFSKSLFEIPSGFTEDKNGL